MALTYAIHPAIGIARLGNSTTTHFVGPEIPGVPALPDDGKFRDAEGRIKRQACRFRIFEYDDADPTRPVREITLSSPDIASVTWQVHLVNQKAEWFTFGGLVGEGPEGYPADWPRRNLDITDPAERKRKLVIDFGPRSIQAPTSSIEFRKGLGGGYPETSPGPFVDGNEITSLGTLFTDAEARIEVAGGYGLSGSTGPLSPDGALDFANNDGWFDDTSDGPVTATLVFQDGHMVSPSPAWVIVGPPDFAPAIGNIVSMHDLLYDLALRQFVLNPAIYDATAVAPFQQTYLPSFTKEIYPILQRALGYRWVNKRVHPRHTSLEDFINLSKAPVGGTDPFRQDREDIFNRVRDPDHPHAAGNRTMPRLWGDEGTGSNLTLTRTQYFLLRQWMEGRFLGDWNGEPQPVMEITPSGLDRAALENCTGGAFFPGIEAGWIMRDPRIYERPFTFRFMQQSVAHPDGLTSGDITKRSALPWQADFLQCGDFWWPAQRPNQVLTNSTTTVMLDWTEGIPDEVAMTKQWSLLGFVVKLDDRFVETERKLPRTP